MSRLRSFLGYAWALLALPIILVTFIGLDFWSGEIVAITGLKVSPWFTGGEVAQTINHGEYQTLIHRPVFEGLIRKRNKGFVQINWQAEDGVVLPQLIVEEIDYDNDRTKDFRIRLNTETDKGELISLMPNVIGIENVYRLENERVIRVTLKNKITKI